MNKSILIAITAILMAGAIAPSLNAAPPLPTYTTEEYVSMLPDWDEIDQSEILLRPPETPAGQLQWQHREWYWSEKYAEGSFLSYLEETSGELVPSGYEETTRHIIYNWMPVAYADYDTHWFILAWWNVTDQDWHVLMYNWNEGFVWDDFPKYICDFSIDDLPLEEEWPLWMIIGTVIVALCIIVPVILGVATYRIGKRR